MDALSSVGTHDDKCKGNLATEFIGHAYNAGVGDVRVTKQMPF